MSTELCICCHAWPGLTIKNIKYLCVKSMITSQSWGATHNRPRGHKVLCVRAYPNTHFRTGTMGIAGILQASTALFQ